MAPRRGGGSSSGSGSTVSNKCSYYDAFETPAARALVAFQGLFIFLSLLLLLYSYTKRQLMQYTTFLLYSLSVFFYTITTALSLIGLVLSECGFRNYYSYYGDPTNELAIAATWVWRLQAWLLLWIALFPVCARFYNAFKPAAFKGFKIVHGITITILAVMYIASLSMMSAWNSDAGLEGLVQISGTTEMYLAASFLTAMVAILAGTSVIIAWSRSGKLGGRPVLGWALVFSIALATVQLSSFGITIDRGVYLSVAASIAVYVVQAFLELIALLAILCLVYRHPINNTVRTVEVMTKA